MGANTGVSCVLALVMALLVFSGCQATRQWLAATPLRTILGGFITSQLFTFLLTFICNLETLILGDGVQAGLFPEVVLALMCALSTAALIHRVCVTTCVLFSGVSLYYIHKLSQKTHAVVAPTVAVSFKKNKKNIKSN